MENKQTVKCADCGKDEEYDMKPGYPRKYCAKCSAIRKAEFEGKRFSDTQAPAPKQALMSQKEISISAHAMNKCYYFGNKAESNEEVYDRYQAFVKILEQNG